MPNKLFLFCKKLILFSVALTFALPLALAADTTPPVTTKVLDPASPDGRFSWYVTPVDITLTATDLDSGVQSINYKIDNGVWQKVSFSNTLNLVPNPSFENYSDISGIYTEDWEKTTSDGQTSYTRDTSIYAPGFDSTSIKINTTGTGWHGVNHAAKYATSTPLSNMSASVWLQTFGVTGSAYFKIYSVSLDINGLPTYTYLAQSPILSGSAPGQTINLNFVNTDVNSVGVYMDIGLDGPGTVWVDAASISNSSQTQTTTFTVGSDSTGHEIEYYSDDRSGNIEAHDCANNIKCIKFKMDVTPPGNWQNSGAFRGLFGSDHELYVYTEVLDDTSGISTLTDSYTYHTDTQPGFGSYSNILACNSTWRPNQKIFLISPPFIPGAHDAYLLTPKTDFCNNDWKTCKTVRFYSEDVAGNSSTKDYCINGPWIKFRGAGMIRSNQNINMISEPEEASTDGVIEAEGTAINYFTSVNNWRVTQSTRPVDYNYDGFKKIIRVSPTTRTSMTTSSGVYLIDGDFEIKTATIPSGYSTATFNQIYFIKGNLKITNNISIANASTALFIVQGKTEIAKAVDTVKIAVFADGDFYTAYNIAEGDTTSTLNLNGIYSANKFWFQRTLQGTNNTRDPSESFIYEPKYATQLTTYLGTNSIVWKTSQ